MNTSTTATSTLNGLGGVAARLRHTLPQGRTLPEPVWLRRHRFLLGLLWLQSVALTIFALTQGNDLAHSVQEGGALALIAGLAVMLGARRRLASVLVSFGLISASAILVHLSGGVIEAHFSFFVMIALLALYEDWVPFLLAAAFVVLHHGVIGVISPESVYNHPDAIAHPWKWAAVHGGFVIAAGVASVATWRLNEDVRTETMAAEAEARRRTAQQERVAVLGQRALAGAAPSDLMRAAAAMISEQLEFEVASVLELNREAEQFDIRAAVGLPPGEPLRAVPAGTHSQAGFTVLHGEPVVVLDWSAERRFTKPLVLRELDISSGATVVIQARGEPFGVLGAQSVQPRHFGSDDVNFLQAVANVIASAVERRDAEEEIRERALSDSLTGLPNRTVFLDRLRHALSQAHRHGQAVAVLYCDVDQFKLVNDSLGHEAGDGLLRSVGRRLGEAVRAGDTVARFGGDEFAILVEDVEDERDATEVAERAALLLAQPFEVAGKEHFVSASIGISIGDGMTRPEALIRDADAAMYRAKEQGHGRFEIFSEVLRARAIERLAIGNELRRAVERDELRLYYQPIVSAEDGTIVALEALIRWQHPKRGLIGPGQFIAIAEDSGLIMPVGRWVLEQACGQLAAWKAARPENEIGLCVNLSPRQLADPDLARDLARLLASKGLAPSSLSLEITENALMEKTAPLTEALESLSSLGCQLLLDDFGTGFSSLGYLKNFPLDGIKIDRSFVETIGHEKADAAIVRAIVGIADDLGLRLVAEGVETEEQLRQVRDLGCRYVQGYYFQRAMPPEEVSELLTASAGAAAQPNENRAWR